MNTDFSSAISAAPAFSLARAMPSNEHSTHSPREALMELAGPPRGYARGQHLFHAGDRDANLYFVESGSVKLYGITAGGAEQIFGFCLPGELFGLDVLGGPVHGCSAGVLEQTMVRALPVPEIRALYQRVPAVQQGIHRLLARRINELYDQMMVLSKKHADERLAGFLLGLDARLSGPQCKVHKLQLSMSRYEIGCYLGLALETVSRLLRRFDDEGLTCTRARRIQLCDIERLGALAGQTMASTAMITSLKFSA